MNNINRTYNYISKITYCVFMYLLLCFTVACDVIGDRLSRVGTHPQFNKMNVYEENIDDPMKMQADTMASSLMINHDKTSESTLLYDGYDGKKNSKRNKASVNSIWRHGARSFLRSHRVGDIISVVMTVQDQAKFDNSTKQARKDTGSMSLSNIFGVEKFVNQVIPNTSTASTLLNTTGGNSYAGNGQIDRKEQISSSMAAIVVRILPSGNLIIKGTQEIRINYELREVTIEGIVRPEDISNKNTVQLANIAEARMSYGGRGNVSDLQQAPYGQQIVDAISPF